MAGVALRRALLAGGTTAFVIVVAAMVLASNPSLAMAADGREAARAKMKAGAALMERGDAAGALAEFEAAYRLFPSPKIQFNIAAACEQLSRFAAAYGALSTFLADPGDAPSESVAKARAWLAALEKKVARVAIVSDTAGDEIVIDGQTQGSTPAARPFVVDPGSHKIVIKRGDAEQQVMVTLGEGEERSLNVKFLASPPAEPAAKLPSQMEAGVLAGTPMDPSIPPAMIEADGSQRAATTERPLYKRPWFWGAVAVGALALGILLAFSLGETGYPSADRMVTLP
jgi:hypothetical protein